MKLKNRTINQSLKAISTLEKEHKMIVYYAITSCKHKDLAECGYRSSDFGSAAPIRICLKCGLAEEGWGCGHIVLDRKKTSLDVTISRDDLYRIRTVMFCDAEKTQLLRREISLDGAVAAKLGIEVPNREPV